MRKDRAAGLPHMNCIVLFNKDQDAVLFCKRQKDPYKGKFNFVGGKVEEGEASLDAAYRELEEETGITAKEVCLYPLMDLTYYYQKFVLEIYVGMVEEDVPLREEKNPLVWLPLTEDFTDRDRFAGDQNIAHIVNVALMFPIPGRRMLSKGLYIGIDGCRKGWCLAALDHGRVRIEKHCSLEAVMERYPAADGYLIDMAIGLPEKKEDRRPEEEARKLLKGRGSTVFPIPCRQAVYAKGEGPEETEEARKAANRAVLGKSLAKQSLAILPKIREADEYLEKHPEYKNVLCESHPELCFAGLKGEVVRSSKSDFFGMEERMDLLSSYIDLEDPYMPLRLSKELGCRADDILDALCLAVTAGLKAGGFSRTVPEVPERDARGLTMQMVIPAARKGRERQKGEERKQHVSE